MAWNLVGLTRLLRDASGLLADGDRAPAGTEAADSTSPIPSTAEPTHPTTPGARTLRLVGLRPHTG